MPVINLKIWDVNRISRCDLTREELEELLPQLKMEIEEVAEDEVIAEVAHDRADLFSAEGIGRAIRYLLGKDLPRRYDVVVSNEASVHVDSAPSYRPYIFMSIVRNVKLDNEAIRQLFQLQEKLHLTHCDDRRLVSIGLYDLDTLKPPFRYVAVRNFRFTPLDELEEMSLDEILVKTEKGRKYAHLVKKGEYPLLVDSNDRVLSFPPIINSDETKVTEKTRNIVIDVTGPEPNIMAKVLSVITLSVLERTYGSTQIEVVPIVGNNESLTDKLVNKLNGKDLKVARKDIESLLGFSLSKEELSKVLIRMGYVVNEVANEYISVWVPPYRIDVIDTVDVIEDVAIGYGYENISARLPPPTHTGVIDPLERFTDVVRELMTGMGYNEVVNFIMIDKDILSALTSEEYVEVKNPKLKSYSALRNSMIPSILIAIKVNTDLYSNFKIFEVGDVIKIVEGEAKSVRMLGFANVSDGVTITDALATIKTLMKYLGVKYEVREVSSKIFIPSRAASVIIKGNTVGVVGEIHPEVLVGMGINRPAVVGELNLALIYKIITGEQSIVSTSQ